MELYSIVIILLAIAMGLSPLATHMKVPYPILLLVVGVAVGFIPGFQRMTINPEVVFLIFLPPMLYDAACNISFDKFKANLQTISTLAIVLIFVTTTGIAVVTHFCIPNMPWSVSFVLGAILSPPDAIAATGVTKGLGLSHRTSAILEGESLINDASALVVFRFAVAAVAGSAFVFWEAGLMFLVALVGGALVGVALWWVFFFVAKKLRSNSSVVVGLNLMLPFVAYLLAEELHVSGVIAVVVVGVLVAMHHDDVFEKEAGKQTKAVWDTLIFLLGGLVFILIGVEFPHVLKNIPPKNILPLIGGSFLIFLVALIIRMSLVLLHKVQMDNNILVFRRGHIMFLSKIKRDHLKKSEPLNIKDCLVIGWSGMRGIVSLAAALSLPLLMKDGSMFPQRDTIIFLTVAVVIIMLMVQGLGLPVLIKILKGKGEGEESKTETGVEKTQ